MSVNIQEVIPVLPARDVTSLVNFYVEILGFSHTFQDSAENPGYAGVQRDHASLHIQWHDNSEWSRVERPSIRFRVHDVENVYAEFKAKGILHRDSALRDTPWGTREFGLFDPESNGLTFYRPNS